MTESLRTESAPAHGDYDRLRDDAALLDLAAWSLISLTGDDRKGWLQGQATNDLREFDRGASKSFCLCTATGQIQAVVDGWGLEDRFLLTCEKGAAPAVLDRVERMVVLEDVIASDLTDQYVHFSIQGRSASRLLGELVDLPTLDACETELEGVQVWVLRSRRTAMGGWDLWIPTSAKKAISRVKKAFERASAETYEILRVEAGIPAFGRDYTEKTLASELGKPFVERHISFTKGCYTGQEVLMRIYSRGHTNRTWVGLFSDHPITVGSSIRHRLNPSAGSVTSAVLSPEFGPIAAAMVRNEIAHDEEPVTISTESGEVRAEVRLMPF